MNKTLKLISLSLLTIIPFSISSVDARCVDSGFGVGISVSAVQNKANFNPKNVKSSFEKKREDIAEKLKKAVNDTKSKFSTPNTKDTKMVLDNGEYQLTAYKASTAAGKTDKIEGLEDESNATKLSNKSTVLKLKTRKPGGNNPTDSRVLDINKEDPTQSKYDDNGMLDPVKGKHLPKQLISVQPYLLVDNNITLEDVPNTANAYTESIGNYAKVTVKENGTDVTYYIVPKDFDLLSEMISTEGNNTNPTHSKLNGGVFTSSASDKITQAFLNDIIKNDSTLNYKQQFTGDEWYIHNNNVYIDTVKHSNLGLTDDMTNNAISKLDTNAASSNMFRNNSIWVVCIEGDVFYQWRVGDYVIRPVLFINWSVANKSISLEKNNTNQTNSNNKSSNNSNELSLTHSFDIGGRLLVGYNVTTNFMILGGVEVFYAKFKLNNMNRILSNYSLDDNKLVNWLAAGSSKEEVLKDYKETLKNYGLSDNTKEKSFGKWSFRGVIGVEFNYNNVMLGLQGFFGPKIQLMKASNSKDLGDCDVTNAGVRATLGYKF